MLQYLKAVGREIFTSKSKGAVALLIVYFYVTFIFAVTFFLTEADVVTPADFNPATGNNTLCSTLTSCYVALVSTRLHLGVGLICSRRIVIYVYLVFVSNLINCVTVQVRLTLFDGTGFDLLGFSLAMRPGYGLLMIGYCCFASFVLLNGLIGVFRTVFDEVADDRVKHGAPSAVERGLAATGALGRARWSMRTHPWFPLLATAYAALALIEPFVIVLHDYVPRNVWIDLQFVVLFLSTGLCIAVLVNTCLSVAADVEWNGASGGSWAVVRVVVDGVAAFELFCFAFGWGLLLFNPGLATLRCLRIFRILWLVGLDEALLETGETRIMTLAKLGHLTLRC